MKTPMGLRKIAGTTEGSDFPGYENKGRGSMRRLVNAEREMRFMKDVGKYHGEV